MNTFRLAVVDAELRLVAVLDSVICKDGSDVVRLKGSNSRQAHRLSSYLTSNGVKHELANNSLTVSMAEFLSTNLDVTLRPDSKGARS